MVLATVLCVCYDSSMSANTPTEQRNPAMEEVARRALADPLMVRQIKLGVQDSRLRLSVVALVGLLLLAGLSVALLLAFVVALVVGMDSLALILALIVALILALGMGAAFVALVRQPVWAIAASATRTARPYRAAYRRYRHLRERRQRGRRGAVDIITIGQYFVRYGLYDPEAIEQFKATLARAANGEHLASLIGERLRSIWGYLTSSRILVLILSRERPLAILPEIKPNAPAY